MYLFIFSEPGWIKNLKPEERSIWVKFNRRTLVLVLSQFLPGLLLKRWTYHLPLCLYLAISEVKFNITNEPLLQSSDISLAKLWEWSKSTSHLRRPVKEYWSKYWIHTEEAFSSQLVEFRLWYQWKVSHGYSLSIVMFIT